MENKRISASSRMLFSVRYHAGEYILENICGTLKHKPPILSLKDAFPAKAAEKITEQCKLAISGHQDGERFSADLGYHEPHLVSLIHHDQFTSFFSAEPLASTDTHFHDTASKALDKTPYFNELFDSLNDGMFVWQVCESNEYILVYANPAFYAQINLPCDALGQTYKEIFSRTKAVLIERCHLDICFKTSQPLKYNSEYDEKHYSVSLYPVFEDNNIVRIVGISTDMTEHVAKVYQLECTNNHLMQNEQFLREQIIFEELIARISRKYMDSGHSGFTACTDQLITGLGKLLQVDWACVWKNEDIIDGQSSQWYTDSSAKGMHLSHTDLEIVFGAWINQFRSGRIIVINDLESEKQNKFSMLLNTARKDGLRSILIVPILRGGDLWGVISVSQQKMKRIWTTVEIARLKTAADTIMSAYLRIKMEKQLNESNRVLVEYDECLQDMLAVQESLSKVSKQYTSVDYHHFESCTNNMLEVLGGLTDVDHACIHVFEENTSVTFEWCKRGLPCINLQTKNPVSGWMDFLRNNDHITVSNVAEGPLSIPSFLTDNMLSLGIKSFMLVPIRDSETLWGVLVLSKVLGCHSWNNSCIQTSKQFADVFLGAYLRTYREQQQIKANQTYSVLIHEAVKQADVLRKVAKSAHMFINATSENLKEVFSSVCKEIAETLQIESISLTRYSEDFTKTCVVFDWVSSVIWSKHSGNFLNRHDHTVLSIPVLYHDVVWGCLLVNFASEKPGDAYVDTLELMAQYCVCAYMQLRPNKTPCFSTNPEKSFRQALSLSTQPAVI